MKRPAPPPGLAPPLGASPRCQDTPPRPRRPETYAAAGRGG
eukprot:CAMPEP_0118976440 /NCGR_PEP_ID=MMETSP1173-20130426/18825_1 /TAXON_ID=1034831 /ORGANISM="Rhizochromulina marina cf, Strain CCMP1243" /LENGTH=40 /DNA_ID= /DNA_START= /DNA_END= /DNA_ORIENTATION=